MYDVPVIPVNHLEGHMLSVELPNTKTGKIKEIIFPALALVVSGGHTELVLLKSHTKFVRIGHTLDDAAGEAFDKVAKLMGLSYPGGPAIEKVAETGDAKAYDFPRPMAKHDTYDFSYAGLKTAVRIAVNKRGKKKLTKKVIADISASFQLAVVESLIIKLEKTIDAYKPKTIIFGGGVANNKAIRKDFLKVGKKNNIPALMCSKKYAGDNSSMISWAGYYNLRRAVPIKKFYTIKANPQLTYKLRVSGRSYAFLV
jgi:N6-L-threonylcarbamoyladenine synthase